MKIVMNKDGKIVGRHADADVVSPVQYQGFGNVLIGNIDDSLWSQDASGRDLISGSIVDVARELARQMVRDNFEAEVADINVDYPLAERDTFSIKLAEARGFLNQTIPEADCIYLKARSEASDESVEELAQKVVANASIHAAAIGRAEAHRSQSYKAIDSAKNVEAIMEVLY